jgi:hypothetical protein
MNGRGYTDDEINFIRDMVINKSMGYKQLAPLFNEKFNRNASADSLGAVAKRNGIRMRCTRKHGWYTEEQKAFIIDMVTNNKVGNNKLMLEFNKKFNENKNYDQIKHIVKVLGLSFDECYNYNEYTEEEKNFIVEMVIDKEMDYYTLTPIFNKKFDKDKTTKQIAAAGFRWGLKNVKCSYNWINEDLFEKVTNTKKDLWYNRQEPVGTVKIFNCSHFSKAYIKIKLVPKELFGKNNKMNQGNKIFLKYWYPYDKYIYEQHYNVKLKDDETIQHLDGNRLNNDISNLMCVHVDAFRFTVRNGYYNDPETRSIGFKLGELRHLIKQGEKNDI